MIVQILILLGAVGLFLFGMKTMSEAVQKLSGNRLRTLLSAMTASPARGIVAGTAITGIVQSSSATTVMIVSFVNARLLRLEQAIAMVMGANIGTTVTAWLVVLFGFSFNIEMAALPLIGIGFPLLLLRAERLRQSGNTVIGLALMLLAIHILQDAVTTLSGYNATADYVALLNGGGALSPLLYALAGALLTAALQSSSVTSAVTIILCCGGLIPFESGLAMILGENLGTTLTANLAATMTGAEGKRTALSHLLFNLFGVLWVLPLLGPITHGIDALMVAFGAPSPLVVAPEGTLPVQPIGLALFHTLFNLFNTLLLAPFIPRIAQLTRWLIPGHTDEKPQADLEGGSLVSTSEIALLQAREDLAVCIKHGGELASRIRDYFGEINAQTAAELYRLVEQRVDEQQKIYDQYELRLGRLAQQEMSHEARLLVQSLSRLLTQLRAATWLCMTAARIVRRKKERNIWFTQPMREDLGVFFSIIQEAYFLTYNNLSDDQSGAPQREERRVRMQAFLAEFLTSLEEKYLDPSDSEEMLYQAGLLFVELTSCIGRLAQYVLLIAENTSGIGKFEK